MKRQMGILRQATVLRDQEVPWPEGAEIVRVEAWHDRPVLIVWWVDRWEEL